MLRAPALVAAVSCLWGAACSDDDGAPPDPMVCQELAASPSWRSPLAPGAGHRSQCGRTLELVPINEYQGALAGAQEREDAVALINGSCTGTLVAAATGPVVLTAGHCVGLGDRSLVAFNVEAQPDGDLLVTEGTVIERADAPDYALIQLDRLPASAPTPLTTLASERLAVIQHPRGRPKVIAEGDFAASCNQLVYYTDLDTLTGSSGAGVLNQQGYLLGIHTDGDCTEDGRGTNFGWTAAGVVAASAYLQDGDIAER